MSSRLCLPLGSSQRIRPPVRAAQGGEESAGLGVGRWVLNNPSSTSSKSFSSEPVSSSVKWGRLRALLAFWVSSSVQCPRSRSWEPSDASDSQLRPPHPSWLPAAGPPAAPQGSRTSRSPWTTPQRRKPNPSEGHRVGTGQAGTNARAADSCSDPAHMPPPRTSAAPVLLAVAESGPRNSARPICTSPGPGKAAQPAL